MSKSHFDCVIRYPLVSPCAGQAKVVLDSRRNSQAMLDEGFQILPVEPFDVSAAAARKDGFEARSECCMRECTFSLILAGWLAGGSVGTVGPWLDAVTFTVLDLNPLEPPASGHRHLYVTKSSL